MKDLNFLYHCKKPESIIDVLTTQPDLAEQLSKEGCYVTAKRGR